MSRVIDLATSFGATLASGAGGAFVGETGARPERLLELYEFEACPYCRLVREALTELDLDALILPSPHGGTRFRPKAAELGGKQQFPYLVDPNTGRAMYESDAIITYLYAEYGRRAAPARLLRPFDVASSTLASLPRLAAGASARASKSARRPLELFSFESSPYSRRVRELLCELELRYVLRSTGKALWQDLGPPSLRTTLFPDLPVVGRNREAQLARAGRVQVPYLVDPNTGVEMFESTAIRDYLIATYAATAKSTRKVSRRAPR